MKGKIFIINWLCIFLFSCMTTVEDKRIHIIILEKEKKFPFDEQIAVELAINYLKQEDYYAKNDELKNEYDLLNPLVDHQIFINEKNENEKVEVVFVIFQHKSKTKKNVVFSFKFVDYSRMYLSYIGLNINEIIKEKTYQNLELFYKGDEDRN